MQDNWFSVASAVGRNVNIAYLDLSSLSLTYNLITEMKGGLVMRLEVISSQLHVSFMKFNCMNCF